MLPHYNVVVQPQQQHHLQQQQHGGGNHVTASLMGLPGSRQQHLQQQPLQQYQNLPSIVVHQPGNVQCGNSATFQRLGMREESLVSEDAKAALETSSLSPAQTSPPVTGHHDMELLTPSPVVTSHPGISPEHSSVQDGVSLEFRTPQPSKLQQVRMMKYPVNQTPCAVTPGHALRGRKSSLKKTQNKGSCFYRVDLKQFNFKSC